MKDGQNVVYITAKQSPMYKQMTVEDLLFSDFDTSLLISKNESNTRTVRYEQLPQHLSGKLNVQRLVRILAEFNKSTEHLREQDRHDLYHSFLIPKRDGSSRRIDAPRDELMDSLYTLKEIFEKNFMALTAYHTSAFAYIKGRSTIDAVKRHQANESRWFAKFDLSNFFGNTTMDFVMKQLSMIYPFSEVVKVPEGDRELRKALELAFLDGGLPQGTPISPLITNIIMIPIDFALANQLRDFNGDSYVYTRYADDFLVSCRYSFKFRDVEDLLVKTLEEFGAPFKLNRKKTRYGSSAGSNFNLGVMLNANNEITIGSKRHRMLNKLTANYCKDIKNGKRWDLSDAQVFAGQLSYFKMVEPTTFDNFIKFFSQKYSMDVMCELKCDLKQ